MVADLVTSSQHNVGVEVHLGPDVRRMVHALSLAEQVFVIHTAEEERLLGRQSEHLEVAASVLHLDRPLPPRVDRRTRQVLRRDTILVERSLRRHLVVLLVGVEPGHAAGDASPKLHEHLANSMIADRH